MKRLNEYIEEHKLSWSESTVKSERSRLRRLLPHIGVSPPLLWKHIQSLRPYSRVTAWTRFCSFYDWLLEKGYATGVNVYTEWRTKNAKQFKHTYERKLPTMSYHEAKRRIENAEESNDMAKKAMELLNTGLRFQESTQASSRQVIASDSSQKLQGVSSIKGKGGKRRRVFGQTGKEAKSQSQVSHTTLWRWLKRIELTPHMLRKIFATHLVRNGFKEADLCKVMGWSSFETARSYIAPMDDEKIEKKIKEITANEQ